jgi:hypothetical protein
MRGPIIMISAAMLVALAAALAQTQEQTPGQTPGQTPAAEPAIHGYGDRDKTCLAWTDACSSCERGDGDAVHCSNIGIACQPAAITCSRRSEPAKGSATQGAPGAPASPP